MNPQNQFNPNQIQPAITPTSPPPTGQNQNQNQNQNQPQLGTMQMPQPGQVPTPGQVIASQNLQQNAQNVQNQQTAQSPQNFHATPDLPISTQSTLLISELRDGVVIMKDGSFRAVIACQSINYDLMSETERDGVEYSYQQFINSLNFTTQILVRSQRIDIGPYLERLAEIRRNNDNMLLGVLMDDYIDFIDEVSQEANIMDKSFFIIIPFYPDSSVEQALQQTKNFFKSFSKRKEPEVTKIDRTTYDNALKELENRVGSVMDGLFRIGIHAVRLNTRELASLYYNFNNPDTAVREPLVDFNQVATTYVKKGERNV